MWLSFNYWTLVSLSVAYAWPNFLHYIGQVHEMYVKFLWNYKMLYEIQCHIYFLSSVPYFFPSLYGFLPYVNVSFPLVHVFNFGCHSLGATNLLWNFYTSGQKSRDSHRKLTCSFGERLHLTEHLSGYQESTLKLRFVKLKVYHLMTNKISINTNYKVGIGHWSLSLLLGSLS